MATKAVTTDRIESVYPSGVIPTLKAVAAAATAFTAARTISAGTALFGRAAGLSLAQSVALGVALLPMSGIAFLLTASLHEAFPEFGVRVVSALAGATTVMEIVGPLAAQWALKRCGEAHFAAPGERHGA